MDRDTFIERIHEDREQEGDATLEYLDKLRIQNEGDGEVKRALGAILAAITQQQTTLSIAVESLYIQLDILTARLDGSAADAEAHDFDTCTGGDTCLICRGVEAAAERSFEERVYGGDESSSDRQTTDEQDSYDEAMAPVRGRAY